MAGAAARGGQVPFGELGQHAQQRVADLRVVAPGQVGEQLAVRPATVGSYRVLEGFEQQDLIAGHPEPYPDALVAAGPIRPSSAPAKLSASRGIGATRRWLLMIDRQARECSRSSCDSLGLGRHDALWPDDPALHPAPVCPAHRGSLAGSPVCASTSGPTMPATS